MNIKPYQDYVVLKKNSSYKTSSGILIQNKEERNRGFVVAVGKGCKMNFETSKEVVFLEQNALRIDDFYVVVEKDIVGGIEDE